MVRTSKRVASSASNGFRPTLLRSMSEHTLKYQSVYTAARTLTGSPVAEEVKLELVETGQRQVGTQADEARVHVAFVFPDLLRHNGRYQEHRLPRGRQHQRARSTPQALEVNHRDDEAPRTEARQLVHAADAHADVLLSWQLQAALASSVHRHSIASLELVTATLQGENLAWTEATKERLPLTQPPTSLRGHVSLARDDQVVHKETHTKADL
eukprot:CAMPEP_0181214634 /NCGR_PEP_ID=MMETSP1096-20121128/25566_1 /TAXON_ID=156174 ORGANISM="Chrysochromulina ericina, Strain CCMP281" /NCGR_SAMPLE_ID=MMETSP1096 /ASSEMBLY_ACC=CAM_ASM_000453 /LENGTH=211 /DNA_ID=CAMNT_0023306399 /DNA_START=366 /DNA_END=1003 /DNA_ORIENTATION=+